MIHKDSLLILNDILIKIIAFERHLPWHIHHCSHSKHSEGIESRIFTIRLRGKRVANIIIPPLPKGTTMFSKDAVSIWDILSLQNTSFCGLLEAILCSGRLHPFHIRDLERGNRFPKIPGISPSISFSNQDQFGGFFFLFQKKKYYSIMLTYYSIMTSMTGNPWPHTCPISTVF